jgi:hypothetical protein
VLIQTLAEVIRDQCMRQLRRGRPAGPLAYLLVDGELREIEVPPFDTRADKQLFFDFLASVGMLLKPTAIAFGGEAWVCDITPDKLWGMSEPDKLRVLGRGSEWLVEHGFSSRFEALNITAQDKQSAYFLTLPFTRLEGIRFGEETRRLLPQSSLGPEMGLRFYPTKQEGPARKAGPF